jgi:hypothetical protein
MVFLAIFVVFFFAFFGNSLLWLKLIPYQVTLLSELSIYFLFGYSFLTTKRDNRVYNFHLTVLFAYFIVITVCSYILSERFDLGPIISLRVIFRFYIFYLALINLGLDERKLKNINKLMFVLFILQLPACAAKFSIHGVSEWTTGTYHMAPEGKTTMMIPIIALGYLAGFYFHYKQRPVYLALGIGFILFGIVSAKAAHLYIMPVTFLGLYYLIFIKERNIGFFKNLTIIVFVLCFSIVTAGAIIKYQWRLNNDRRVGGTLNFSYAFDYTKYYTNAMSPNPKYAVGRLATTKLAFHLVWKGGLTRILFGYGPGAGTGSVFKTKRVLEIERFDRSYGKTGLTVTLIEYGLFGVVILCIVFISFVFLCYRWYIYEKDHYWKALATGSVVFSFLNLACFVGYSTVPMVGDIVLPIFYYAMAVMYIRSKSIFQKSVERQ